ncbi:signal transduction histidine kinase [Acidovorax sp. CF316]|uniref:hybrid sensor histidine kinase/response regulator n=1 Tax=Acidovorax sp. CF316 TaxID=1144317 RepID=UPI00026BC028|nr:hybrid sensor histidine kinase/response regulator [Acidovorax sp. CF316]EJE49088.1 signal transduction histidine kinase [Acidovorax sp. CF316]
MASPAAAPPAEGSDDAPISMEGQARLLQMTFGFLLTSIFVLPLVSLALTLFYAQGHDARWMWVWCGFYALFALVMSVQRRLHLRDRKRLDAQAMVRKWKPRLEACALLHGAGITAPMAIVAGHADYDFALLLLVTNAAIVVGNATLQTPVLSVFMRLYMAGWNASLPLLVWVFPGHWHAVLPLALLFSLAIYRHSNATHRFFVQQVRLEERGAQLAARYLAARDEAQAALEEKNRFLSTAAHDLRQPVHAMGLLAAAIARRNHDPGLSAPLADLQRSVHSVNRMFNSLLDLSRIEGGHVAVHAVPVALEALFGDVLTLFREEARTRGLQLRVRPPGPQAAVLADADLLRQSVVNLVHNALRYTLRGGVLLTARRRRGGWQIEVWDTGVGVALEDQLRIYTPFYRPQHAWNIGNDGHGLGLAVVARCAKLMGADYGLASRLGRGSRFWLHLPAATLVASHALPARHSGLAWDAGGGSPPDLGSLSGTCLIIDDDPQVATAWAALLQAWGISARFASCASEAWALVDTGFTPGAILCDQRLRSGESGFDILRALMAHCPGAYGAMVSGELHSPELQEAESEGYLVLPKPLDVVRLHALLAQWLEPRHGR